MAWMTYISNWFEQDDWYEGLQRANMSQVRQVGLLAAGCQPWNKDVCAASGDRFAYCATLAIYIYQGSLLLLVGAGMQRMWWHLFPTEAHCSFGPSQDQIVE
ncbi:WD repeat domain 17 [Homo sapiens]|uniref:WD repeat domain 17 n=1 Tax=Homo sapiens TaxID=9606 RepID=E9PFA2_HUMAN|nr:WD repeat domain 17 [Homo sapiens]KAI4027736.1 WD repeat domain 17 [Homo sapiens]